MKDNLFTPAETERTLIEIGLNSMEHLVQMSLYREAIATFRGCLEHYITLSVILLCEQLHIDSRDILEYGKLYFSNIVPKKGYYTCVLLDFGIDNKIQVYVVHKQKLEKNSFKQLRESLFNLNTPYTSSITLDEYTAAFNHCSNKASHGVEQLKFKDYNDMVPFINKFIRCYNITCVKYLSFNIRMLDSLDTKLQECVNFSNNEINFLKSEINHISSSLIGIIDLFKNNYSHQLPHGDYESLFYILNKNINKQKQDLTQIELLVNKEFAETSRFSILVLGDFSSGKSTFINLLLNENIFNTTAIFYRENRSVLRDNIKITEKSYDEISLLKNEIKSYDLVIFVTNFMILPKEKNFIKKTLHNLHKQSYIVFTKSDQFVENVNYKWTYSRLFNIDFTKIYAFNSLKAHDALTSNYVDNEKLISSGYVNFMTMFCNDILSNANIYKSASFNNIIVEPIYKLYLHYENFYKTISSSISKLSSNRLNLITPSFYNNLEFLSKLDQVENALLNECSENNDIHIFSSVEKDMEDWQNHVLNEFKNVINDFYSAQKTNISNTVENFKELFSVINKFYGINDLCSKQHKNVLINSIVPNFNEFIADIHDNDLWNLAKIGLGFSFLKLLRMFFPVFLQPPFILISGVAYFLKKLYDYNKINTFKENIVKEIKRKILEDVKKHDSSILNSQRNFFNAFSISMEPFIKMNESLLNEYKTLYGTISNHILQNVFKSLGYTNEDYSKIVKNVVLIPGKSLTIYTDQNEIFTSDFKRSISKILCLKEVLVSQL